MISTPNQKLRDGIWRNVRNLRPKPDPQFLPFFVEVAPGGRPGNDVVCHGPSPMPVEHTRMEETERRVTVEMRGVFVNLRRDDVDQWNFVGLVPDAHLIYLAGFGGPERTAENALAPVSPPLKARKALQYKKSLVGWGKSFRWEPHRKAHRSLSALGERPVG